MMGNYILNEDFEYAVLPVRDDFAVFFRYIPSSYRPWRRCADIPKCKSRREAQRRLDDYARHGMPDDKKDRVSGQT